MIITTKAPKSGYSGYSGYYNGYSGYSGWSGLSGIFSQAIVWPEETTPETVVDNFNSLLLSLRAARIIGEPLP